MARAIHGWPGSTVGPEQASFFIEHATEDASIVPSACRALTSDGQPNHLTAAGILTPSFSALSSSRSFSVPRDPLPTQQATGAPWILTCIQVMLLSRPEMPWPADLAARMMSLKGVSITTEQLGVVVP